MDNYSKLIQDGHRYRRCLPIRGGYAIYDDYGHGAPVAEYFNTKEEGVKLLKKWAEKDPEKNHIILD